jgi:hypothetical protein
VCSESCTHGSLRGFCCEVCPISSGNYNFFFYIITNNNQKDDDFINKSKDLTNIYSSMNNSFNSNLGSYLAGLIEGDGTFAIHDINSKAKKYRPMIIIVFKKADLPLAQFLQQITNSGNIYIKSNRGYIL